MAEKFLTEVDANGARSSYKSVSDITSDRLTDGCTIRLWPGTYTAITTNGGDIAYEGVGDRDEVIIEGGFTLSNTSTGDFTASNMTIRGSNPNSVGGYACVTQLATDGAVNIKLRNVVLANAEYAVDSHGYGTVTLDNIDGSGVDKGIRSNSTPAPGITINYSRLGANACANSGGNNDVAVTIVASTGGSNTGATTKTVTTLIT